MSTSSQHLLLHGVFQALRKAGVPLSIQDYLEGVEALRLMEPFERPGVAELVPARASRGEGPDRRRMRERPRIVWLCQVLWARSAEERRIIDQFVTGEIALPPALEVKKLRDRLADDDETATAAGADPPPVAPALKPKETSGTNGGKASEDKAEAGGEGNSEGEAKGKGKAVPVAFQPPDGDGDMTLPPHRPAPRPLGAPDVESFLLEPKPVIPLRDLATVWRRYFVPSRRSLSRDLDVPATVRAISESGILLRPVLRSRRTNMASLLVLIDVAPGMTPWRSLETTLEASLAPSLSRLRQASLFYFHGAPGEKVYRRRELVDGKLLDEVLSAHRGRPMLVFGEADATRGVFDQRKKDKLAAFLDRARGAEIRPLLWINPMPPNRWPGTTAGFLSTASQVRVLPLGTESLLHAVDILRGARDE